MRKFYSIYYIRMFMVETFFVRFSNIPQSRSLSCCTIFPFFQIKKFLWSKIFLLLKGWSKLIISPIFFKLNFPSESDTKCNQNRIKWYQNPSRSNNIKINPPDSTFQLVISWITPSHLFYYTVSGYTETGGYHTSIWKINSTHRPDHNNWLICFFEYVWEAFIVNSFSLFAFSIMAWCGWCGLCDTVFG